jgi:hypothetical protein
MNRLSVKHLLRIVEEADCCACTTKQQHTIARVQIFLIVAVLKKHPV